MSILPQTGTFKFSFFLFASIIFGLSASISKGDARSGGLSSFDFDRMVVSGFMGNVQVFPSDSDKFEYAVDRGSETSWPVDLVKDGRVLRLEVKAPRDKSLFLQNFDNKDVSQRSLKIKMPSRPLEIHWQTGDVTVNGVKSSVLVNHKKGDVRITESEGAVKVRSHEGNIVVNKVAGDVEAESYRGSLTISEVEGKVTLENFSGRTQINNVSGGLNLTTYSGGMNAKEIKGGIDYSTVRGPISLTGIDGEVNGNSKDAKVVMSFTGKPLARVRSESGAVVVNVPGGKGYWANIGTEKGQLRIPGGLKMEHYGSWKVSQGNVPGGDRGRIFVRTSSGDIKVGR